MCLGRYRDALADGVGFEPTDRLHDRRISSPVHSTALPPIHLAMSTDLYLLVPSQPRVTGLYRSGQPCVPRVRRQV